MGLFTPEREKSREAKEGNDISRRRDPMPRILLASLIAATVVLVSFTIRQAGQPIAVTVSATAELTDEGIRVTGETSLVDGAILELWVAQDSSTGVPERDPDAETTVESGSFTALINREQPSTEDDPRRIHIVFDPVRVSGPQDGEVLSVYGLFGENLGGNLVVETDRGQRLEQVAEIR